MFQRLCTLNFSPIYPVKKQLLNIYKLLIFIIGIDRKLIEVLKIFTSLDDQISVHKNNFFDLKIYSIFCPKKLVRKNFLKYFQNFFNLFDLHAIYRVKAEKISVFSD